MTGVLRPHRDKDGIFDADGRPDEPESKTTMVART